MNYSRTERGIFLSRPNRFIALCRLSCGEVVCHVKNTGRCRELLVPGRTVVLTPAENPDRKTSYDLVAVYKGDRLINMDSAIPNRAVQEFLPRLFSENSEIFPERRFGNSRFDFFIRSGTREIYLEVKGVTLEENGVVRFPDAPTDRGCKHIRELIAAKAAGYEAYLLFVIQMEGVRYLEPNFATDPAFAAALREAAAEGVGILAYDCRVTEDSMTLRTPVPVRLLPGVLRNDPAVDRQP